eukprot:gene14077-5064_t
MAATDVLNEFRKSVKEQGDLVRKLKAEKAPITEIDVAVRELKARKRILEAKELELEAPGEKFDRGKCEDLLKRRFFYTPAFEIYGGVAGLYDFGPVGCAMETNIINIWRSHFVLEEQFLEVRCTQLTPHQVLKASGHVERFTDIMVKDCKNGDCFRADHLLEGHIEKLMQAKNLDSEKKAEYQKILNQIDNFSKDQIWEKLQHYGAKAPVTNNDLTEPVEFNLMFATSIGPGGYLPGFMRPETAQGIFLNFKRLLEYNNGKLPFGGAQIGCGFRNEISPRAGLLRVREFLMAEIEYFVDPECKEHSKFESVADLHVKLFSKESQMSGEPAIDVSLRDAVAKGWIECVGCADRACYDLTQHSNASGEKLVAQVDLPSPISFSELRRKCFESNIDVTEAVMDKAAIGKAFKKNAKAVSDLISKMKSSQIDELENALNANGTYTLKSGNEEFQIEKKMLKQVKRFKKDVHVREVEPHVIEPSFGIGRIMYSVLEHNFKGREGDEQRNWLSLPSMVAPVKCSVLPLSKNQEFNPFIRQISAALTELDISCKTDDSGGSIGRRYARTDEIGIPFGITVDFETVSKEPCTVTLRERNSARQVRCEIAVVANVVNDLIHGKTTWEEVEKKFGIFDNRQETTEK